MGIPVSITVCFTQPLSFREPFGLTIHLTIGEPEWIRLSLTFPDPFSFRQSVRLTLSLDLTECLCERLTVPVCRSLVRSGCCSRVDGGLTFPVALGITEHFTERLDLSQCKSFGVPIDIPIGQPVPFPVGRRLTQRVSVCLPECLPLGLTFSLTECVRVGLPLPELFP